MTQYLIMCRSLTYAQSSARLLERSGITVNVVKAPQTLSSGGCTYALALQKKFDLAVNTLKKNKMISGKMFARSDSGEYIEVKP